MPKMARNRRDVLYECSNRELVVVGFWQKVKLAVLKEHATPIIVFEFLTHMLALLHIINKKVAPIAFYTCYRN